MPSCLCSICTRSGLRPQGSKQSVTTIREHKRTQESKDRLALISPSVLPPAGRCRRHGSQALDATDFTPIQARIASFELPSGLVFVNPPSSPRSFYTPDEHASSWVNGPFALDPMAPMNSAILGHVAFLRQAYYDVGQTLSGHDRLHPNTREELSLISSELSRLEAFKERAWNEQLSSLASGPRQSLSGSSCEPLSASCTREPLSGGAAASASIPIVAMFLVVVLNSVFKLSFKGCRLVLQVLKTIVRLAHAEFSSHAQSSALDTILAAIPSDPLTARKALLLDPESTDYACCPSCFALYPPGEYHFPPGPAAETPACGNANEPVPFDALPTYVAETSHCPNTLQYPKECTFKETPESQPCGALLLRFGETPRPIRIYSYQSFVSWLGRLLSRAEIEPLLDASQASTMSSHNGSVDDILLSEEVRNFSGPDGLPFLRICGSEGRYLFSLFVDWFHPRGNRQGGSAYSAGVILMVCLNLPPTLRYKRENIYLAGVIPGPKAPTLQEVNHLLEPLVLEMRDLWFKGAHFSRTALRCQGRLARCAVVPLVCDLGAGRKVSGHASHSSTFFCSFCQLQKCDINNLDKTSWPRRDCGHFRMLAEQWRNAPNAIERETLFKRFGVRWSSLLLLPYWRPTRYVVIDTMHNLFLGLFQRHCRRIFGMTMKVASQDVYGAGDVDEPSLLTAEELKIARIAATRCSTSKSLKNKFNLRLLRSIYTDIGLGSPGTRTKKELAEEIFRRCAGASSQDHSAPDDPVMSTSEARRRLRARGVVLGRDILELVRADMAATIYPTFLNRAPPDVGSASAGTLSAEQWRTFCMVNLIITLVRIWGHLSESDRRAKLLMNFVDLVAAVRAGTAKRLTPTKINLFEVRILDYMCGLRALFPDISLVPNDHLALHLGEVLRTFGPTHSYWAFPFERCIRLLRNVNTNFHPSAMERTFFTSFCRATNLLVALRDRALIQILQPLIPLIDNTVSVSNGAATDYSPEPMEPLPGVRLEPVTPLSAPIYNALLQRLLAEPHLSDYTYYRDIQTSTDLASAVLNPDAQILPATVHLGRRFTGVGHSAGDSNILLRAPGSSGTVRESVGQIQLIFKHERVIRGGQFRQDIFVAVKIYQPLSATDAHLDPYKPFEGLGARLVRMPLKPEILVIPLCDVVCHVAMCPFESPTSTQMPTHPCSVVIILDESWNI